MDILLTVTFFTFYLLVIICRSIVKLKLPMFTFRIQVSLIIVSIIGTGFWYGLFEISKSIIG